MTMITSDRMPRTIAMIASTLPCSPVFLIWFSAMKPRTAAMMLKPRTAPAIETIERTFHFGFGWPGWPYAGAP